MTGKLAIFIITAASLMSLGACVERTRELTQSEREQIRQFVLSEAPTPEHRLDASFEGKVLLLGYDVSTEEVTPGQAFTITWYWKAERALEEGWGLFTHVADHTGANRHNADGTGDIRTLYPPGRWRRGEYIRDVQEITLPTDWNSNQATFYVGVWKGSYRLRVVEGDADDENRMRAVTFTVGAAGAAPTPQPSEPRLSAQRASGEINPDGRLDEASWATAVNTDVFVNPMTGGLASFRARARTMWDDANLYIGFEVDDRFLKSEYDDHDDELWNQDCVEVMVDPGGRGQNYFELQVSPNGVVFDTRYDRRRTPAAPGHVDWNSGMRAGVQTRGTVNDDEADQGYTVEMAIPWGAFNTGEPPYARPAPGSSWRLNFYVMDTQEDGRQRAAAWSPPRVGDFHMPPRFGHVSFDTGRPTVRAVAPSPAAPSPAGVQVPAAPSPRVLQLAPGLRVRERALDRDQANLGRTLDNAATGDNNRPRGNEERPAAPSAD